MPDLVKPCAACGKNKPHAPRYLRAGRVGNTTKSSCRDCQAELARAWRKNNWRRKKARDTWKGMINRCHNPGARDLERWENHPDLPKVRDYKGRGITVCERWRDPVTGFAAFLQDLGPPPMPDSTLDRIDGDRGYEASNCRWATPQEQAWNRCTTRWLEATDPTSGLKLSLPLTEWGRRTGISRHTIALRLELGWDPERAVSERPRRTSAELPAAPF